MIFLTSGSRVTAGRGIAGMREGPGNLLFGRHENFEYI